MSRTTTTNKTLIETFTKKETGEVISSKVKERHPVETARMKSLVSTLSYPKTNDGRKECGCWDHSPRLCSHDKNPNAERQPRNKSKGPRR